MLKSFFLMVLTALFCLGVQGAEPFQWKAESVNGKLVVSVEVAQGYYLNLDSVLTRIQDGSGKLPPILSLPPKKEINDPALGLIPILPAGKWQWVYGGTPPYQVTVSFQGCRKASPNEPGICLMPQELQLTGVQPPAGRLDGRAVESFYRDWKVIRSHSGAMDKAQFLSFLRQDTQRASSPRGMFDGVSVWAVILLTLLGGLGLNLTPCVLPMIPVNLAIIGANGTKSTCFRRGLLYGCGMAAAYGILGAAVVYTGGSFGSLNSSSWFNFAVGGVFLLLGISMAGVFNIDFSRLFHLSPGNIKGGKDIAALVMGALAALLAGACVAPVVVGVLVFAAGLYADGNLFAPFMGLFLGIGMGLPWPFAAAGLAVLPKPGKFMVTVKYVFAAFIFAGALYYGWLGWSLLPGNFSPQAELVKLAEAGSRAKSSKKALVVDFYATWCKNCMVMKKTVLRDPEVLTALKAYEFVEFQAEKPGDPLIAPLLKLWKVPGFPSFVIVEP